MWLYIKKCVSISLFFCRVFFFFLIDVLIGLLGRFFGFFVNFNVFYSKYFKYIINF